MNPEVLVLLDPTEAEDGGARFKLGKMRFLYAASNNDDHFKNAAAKNNGGMRAILGPPLDSEMNVILARLDPNLEQGVIKKRKEEVGNLIRYILNEKRFDERVKLTKLKASEGAKDVAKLLKAVLLNGFSNSKTTIPGTLFKVLPARPYDLSTIGYDGQNVEYRMRVIEPANALVRKTVLESSREVILTYLGKISSSECAKMGEVVEDLFVQDLTNSNGMLMKRYLQTTGNNKDLRVESVLAVEAGMEVIDNVTIDDVFSEVLNKTNVVAKLADRSALIDAAGPGRRVYQVTVSPKHDMNFEKMEMLCIQAGFMNDNDGNMATTEKKKLEFYWVVPGALAATWKAKVPHKFKLESGSKKKPLSNRQKLLNNRKMLLNNCLEEYVSQYVLPMTNEPPEITQNGP
jgi:hypothetical protein